MDWCIVDGGDEIPAPGGADATAWAWTIKSGGAPAERTVVVTISGTATVAEDVPPRVASARDSAGLTEVERILDWEVPPGRIVFHTSSGTPMFAGGKPGAEFRELAELMDWFRTRGLALVFSGRTTISPGQSGTPQPRAASLINLAEDQLVGQFEGDTRLDAARAGRDWWLEHRERRIYAADGGEALESSSIAIPTIEGAEDVPAPQVAPEQEELLKRERLSIVWTAPTPGDPDSCWMIEVLDPTGGMVGIAVQPEAEDALLTVLEDILPQGAE